MGAFPRVLRGLVEAGSDDTGVLLGEGRPTRHVVARHRFDLQAPDGDVLPARVLPVLDVGLGEDQRQLSVIRTWPVRIVRRYVEILDAAALLHPSGFLGERHQFPHLVADLGRGELELLARGQRQELLPVLREALLAPRATHAVQVFLQPNVVFVGRAGAVHQGDQADLHSLCPQLLRHLVGDDAPHAFAGQVVGALGLELSHLLDVVGRHLLGAGVRLLQPVEAASLEPVDRLIEQVRQHVADEPQELLLFGVCAGNQEQRGPVALRLQRDEGSRESGLVQAVRKLVGVTAHLLRQLCHGGSFEQLAQGHVHVEHAANAGHDLDRQQGIAAELEEARVHAHTLDTEHLLPDRGDAALHFVARCDVFGLGRRLGGLDGQQGLAVDLAVGRQGQGFDLDEADRDHVGGKLRGRDLAQIPTMHIGAVQGHEVGHEALVAGLVLAHDTDALLYSGALQQHRLDLAELDAEAADLDLVIGAAQVLQVSARGEAGQVARSVQA